MNLHILKKYRNLISFKYSKNYRNKKLSVILNILQKIKFLNVENFDNSNSFKISLYMIWYIWDWKETSKASRVNKF
jgi:hypothetical protein